MHTAKSNILKLLDEIIPMLETQGINYLKKRYLVPFLNHLL